MVSENTNVSLRIFGRDLTISCPESEVKNLEKACALLNEELSKIQDKNNALILAGLNLANALLENTKKDTNIEAEDIINKIDFVLKS
mgnify:FL=1|jgi:cell division protein ZapA (FtsZ GTPase activity inhibitor)